MDEQTNTGTLNQLTYIDLFHHYVLLQNYALRDKDKEQRRPGEGLQELEPSSEGASEMLFSRFYPESWRWEPKKFISEKHYLQKALTLLSKNSKRWLEGKRRSEGKKEEGK